MLGAGDEAAVQVQDQVPVLQGVPQRGGPIFAPEGWGLPGEGEPGPPRGRSELPVNRKEREPD